MTLTFSGGKAEGTIVPPPSKSHTHRAFLLAAMADGQSVISNPLMSADTISTLECVRAMGVHVSVGDDVEMLGGNLEVPEGVVDVGNSGTTLRLFTAIASTLEGSVTLTGDRSIRNRPMGPLMGALESLGVTHESCDGFPPITVSGPNLGGEVSIGGDVSSQFISALMVAAPRAESATSIRIVGNLLSRPYVDITHDLMSRFGARLDVSDGIVRIETGEYVPHDYRVPADFSSAAFLLAAGALGGNVAVSGVDMGDPQGDKVIVDILREAGAVVSVKGDSVIASKGRLRAIDVDVGAFPDLFPIVAVLMSVADGESRLHGAPHLRLKETDRIQSTVAMLRSIGADAEATADGCIIHGRETLSGGMVDHGGDHRIMMSAAVASLVCDKPVAMADTECHRVSYPGFIDDMAALGIRVGFR